MDCRTYDRIYTNISFNFRFKCPWQMFISASDIFDLFKNARDSFHGMALILLKKNWPWHFSIAHETDKKSTSHNPHNRNYHKHKLLRVKENTAFFHSSNTKIIFVFHESKGKNTACILFSKEKFLGQSIKFRHFIRKCQVVSPQFRLFRIFYMEKLTNHSFIRSQTWFFSVVGKTAVTFIHSISTKST